MSSDHRGNCPVTLIVGHVTPTTRYNTRKCTERAGSALAMSPQGRGYLLLLAGTAAGLAALPLDLTAQAGPGEVGRSLGAWMEEARESPFHVSMQASDPENPTVDLAVDVGTGNPHTVWSRMPPVPDSAASPGKVFAYTLVGAMIPLLPGMIWGVLAGRVTEDALSATYVGGLATPFFVFVAAIIAGVDSLPRTLVSTAVGFGAGLASFFLSASLPNEEFWIAPIFSLTMASVTTAIAAR